MPKDDCTTYTFVIPSDIKKLNEYIADYAACIYFLTAHNHSKIDTIIDDQASYMSPHGVPFLIHFSDSEQMEGHIKHQIIPDTYSLMDTYHHKTMSNGKDTSNDEAICKIQFTYVYEETRRLLKLLSNDTNHISSRTNPLIKNDMTTFLEDIKLIWKDTVSNICTQNRYVVRLKSVIFGLLHTLVAIEYEQSSCLQNMYVQLCTTLPKTKRNIALFNSTDNINYSGNTMTTKSVH